VAKYACSCVEVDRAVDPCEHGATSEGCYVHDPALVAAVAEWREALAEWRALIEWRRVGGGSWEGFFLTVDAASGRVSDAAETAGVCVTCGVPTDGLAYCERCGS
jgi:hypothetical protein